MRECACSSQKREIGFVTETAGLKRSDSRWKAWDVRKMLDRGDGERIGQRWMKRAREMCISLCLHFVCLSVSISLCLSLSGLTHCPWLLLRSLTLMEFREGARKEQGSQTLLPQPSPPVWCLPSASFTARPSQAHPHTQVKDMHAELVPCAPTCMRTRKQPLAVSKLNTCLFFFCLFFFPGSPAAQHPAFLSPPS